MRAAQRDQPLRRTRAAPGRRRVPVEPGDLVVLALGVVVAALRAPDLVAAEQHRHALREQQRREQVALLPRAQRDDLRIVGRALDAAVPRALSSVPSRFSSPFASLCFSLYETRSRSVKPSCAVMKLIDAHGPPAVRLVEVARAGEPRGELAHGVRVAAPEVAHRVAIAAVPLGPEDGKLPTW